MTPTESKRVIKKEIETMIECTWMRMLKPYGYHDIHAVGEEIPVDDKEDVKFFVANGIAEIMETEVLHFKTESDGIVKLPES